MTTVATIDFDQVYSEIVERLRRDTDRRFQQPEVRLFDGDWNYRGTVYLEKKASFQVLENETGTAVLEMPASYYLAKWLTEYDTRSTKNVNITMDKDGIRWDGMLEEVEREERDGIATIRATFKHSYEHLKHIICFSNPWLPPEVQFPRLWIMFGPAKWALKFTLLANIMRLESSLWALPDDPMDASQWFDFDQSNWSMVVAPLAIEDDNSQFAVVHSRFKKFHDVAKRILDDAQLTVTTRRWLTGDPPPWAGADLKHGCLVIDIVDKSGWDTETSFGGNLFTGLVRSFMSITGDGLNGGEETVPDPTFPAEYSTPGHKGTVPRAPGVILRAGDVSAIESSSFKYKPPTDVGVVTGGHSMPGVNELISFAIQMAGDLTAMAIGVPPLGGAADAILSPLYTDVLLAFQKWRDIGRANQLSSEGFYYHEAWGEGADRAYTLAALIALRTGFFLTDEKFTHTVKVVDGIGELRIGDNGKGNAYIGDRVGTTVKDWGTPGRVYVDRISELNLTWDRDTAPTWDITVGHREAEDPLLKAFELIQDLMSITSELGVI